jgi:flagellar hook-associated protein 1 FlgK
VEKGDDLDLQLNIGGSSFAVEGKNLGGKFSGLLEVRDELIPSLKEDLDYTAYQMAQEVNQLHEAGKGLDGSSGIPFFQNPGSHTSQVYDSESVDLFSGATVDSTGATVGAELEFEVDGEKYSVTLDPNEEYTLSELATEIEKAQNVNDVVIPILKAEVSPSDNGYVLNIVPKNISSKNSYQSINIDIDQLSPLAGNEAPRFSMPNFADLMTMAVKDPSKVAAGETDAPGDNRKALDIAALKDKKAVNGEDTFVSFYGKMAARVGIEASQNRLEQSGAQDSLTQLKNMRDGAAGVSLEEEMIALVKYQRGFEASAKLLSTVDDMMGTVISIKR